MGIYRRLYILAYRLKMNVSLIITCATMFILAVRYPMIASVTAAVAIHETGHIIAAWIFGAEIHEIKAHLCGITIRYNDRGINSLSFIVISLAGSITGALAAYSVMLTPLKQYEGGMLFAIVSLTLSAVNLLPVKGLDGGVVTEYLLERLYIPEKAERISCIISGIFAVLLWLTALRIQLRVGTNISLLALSVCILMRTLFRN